MTNRTEQDEIGVNSKARGSSSAGVTRNVGRGGARSVLIGILACLLASCHGSGRHLSILVEDPPTSLQMISERAEGIIVAVPAQDWPRVYAYIRDIDNTWRDYKRPTITPLPEPRGYPTGMLFGDLDAALAGLKYEAAARNATETIEAAGNVSGAAADLIGFYNPRRPSGIHRLGVFERRIIIEATESDLAAASTTLDRIRNTWGQVRQAVLGRAGATVVQGFDVVILGQQAAIRQGNPSGLAADARTALQMINDMQQLEY